VKLEEWLEKNDPGASAFDIHQGRVHNWQNHVPGGIQEGWLFLTPNERAIVYLMAAAQADKEEWD
jgi:hypothetical protein